MELSLCQVEIGSTAMWTCRPWHGDYPMGREMKCILWHEFPILEGNGGRIEKGVGGLPFKALHAILIGWSEIEPNR
jgi:hypothetical protein